MSDNGVGPAPPQRPQGTVVVAAYTPAPHVDRQQLAQRVQSGWSRASRLTEAAAAVKTDANHIKAVMLAGAVNNTCDQLASLLEDAAHDEAFAAPMAKLSELEIGLEALGL